MQAVIDRPWGYRLSQPRENLFIKKQRLEDRASWARDSHLEEDWEQSDKLWNDFISVDCFASQPQTDLASLRDAAQSGNAIAFISSYRKLSIETLNPSEFAQIIQLALEVGAQLLAREISIQALKQYPNHDGLRRYERVLAPPKQIDSVNYRKQNWDANRQWLKQFGEQYRGQWVALSDGDLLASASTPKKLRDKLGDLKNYFITIAN